MKKVTTILSLMLIASTVFASDNFSQCKQQVIANAATIKSQAKQELRSNEDMMDNKLDVSGDPMLDAKTRGRDMVAKIVLEAVRALQLEPNMELDNVLKRLCNNELNLQKILGN